MTPVHDYYLRFADQAEADAVLPAPAVGLDIDRLGAVQVPTGNTVQDADGNLQAETVAVPGYHVNVYSNDPLPYLQAYDAAPKNPIRRRAA